MSRSSPPRRKPSTRELEPELIVEQLFLYGRAMEIQVRLAGQEVVQVVLPAPAVPAQAGPPNTGSQLFGTLPSGLGSAQTYQSALSLSRLGGSLREPGVLVRGMIEHLIDQHAHAALVAGLDERTKSSSVPNSGSTPR